MEEGKNEARVQLIKLLAGGRQWEITLRHRAQWAVVGCRQRWDERELEEEEEDSKEAFVDGFSQARVRKKKTRGRLLHDGNRCYQEKVADGKEFESKQRWGCRKGKREETQAFSRPRVMRPAASELRYQLGKSQGSTQRRSSLVNRQPHGASHELSNLLARRPDRRCTQRRAICTRDGRLWRANLPTLFFFKTPAISSPLAARLPVVGHDDLLLPSLQQPWQPQRENKLSHLLLSR
jgi:hypothetical protein